MPTTRKKVINTVYKDEDDSEAERGAGDFSDSGSEAKISEQSSSEDDGVESDTSSVAEFRESSNKKRTNKAIPRRKTKFAKEFIRKINRQTSAGDNEDEQDVAPALFSVKDLTDADKLLPSVLNLSESDSSDDESSKPKKKSETAVSTSSFNKDSDSEDDNKMDYKDVWSQNMEEKSEEIAKKAFMELEQHKQILEEAKASVLNYSSCKTNEDGGFDVKDLLAQGEEVLSINQSPPKKGKKPWRARADSDSDMEDWEEVKDAKAIPQQGLQLVVDIPDLVARKTKKIDIEMMMKRRINRVKKEHQVHMHKVHVLCWLGHGNYVNRVINDKDILAAALQLVPGKECYPGERVDMKYVEQITTWFKDKFTLKQDKYEEKFRPKAPPLIEILPGQMKSRIATTKKYLVYIFVSMLRSLGLQARVMFNFVTVPLRPPTSELCSLAIKKTDEKTANDKKTKTFDKKEDAKKEKSKGQGSNKGKSKVKLSQVDGNYDSCYSDNDFGNIMQVDGNSDALSLKSTRTKRGTKNTDKDNKDESEGVSPPKKARKSPSPKNATTSRHFQNGAKSEEVLPSKRTRTTRRNVGAPENKASNVDDNKQKQVAAKAPLNRRRKPVEEDKQMDIDEQPTDDNTQNIKTGTNNEIVSKVVSKNKNKPVIPKIVVTETENPANTSTYFETSTSSSKNLRLVNPRRRSRTCNASKSREEQETTKNEKKRGKSVPGVSVEKSKYFNNQNNEETSKERRNLRATRCGTKDKLTEDKQRVSHRDILAKNKSKPKNDVTNELVDIIKSRVREAKEDSKKGKVKGKIKQESDEDSDYLPVESRRDSVSDEDFKPKKASPRPSTSHASRVKKIDRRVLSSDDDTPKNKIDVWCEVFVEELEQWVAVDVVKGKAHCTNEIYGGATHPVCYVVGWDNNNYLKDLTRRYVPHWNTVTRKQRAEAAWWDTALRPWLAPKTPRDREEDEQLNRMQLEAPLPKSIAEYKNHPLYALKRHLLKFEALYPPDAATLGFVRGEAVYARECVHVCRSRDTWLKEAKVVRLGETPYKIVKARPKWDKLSNKLITDKPLEVFGPWQVQDYEPPVAENGLVPRNPYGNVELFKDCMLPKGTVHIKLPGLNRVAKKLNIDCAPAMTGFDFNGGWSHPVYDGFVVCKEFEEIVTEAWLKDQEDQERKEIEKMEARVYGNWKRLIKGLLIRERLKLKYGFDEPSATEVKKKSKGPRVVAKKK